MATSTGRVSARDRLLAAAEELFYRDGITATGVDAVVRRADVALGSLYNNFGGKDGLVTAYLVARDARWRETWEQHVAGHDDPVERVLAIFDAVGRWVEDESCTNGCAHLAAAVQLDRDQPGHDVLRTARQAVTARLGELLAAVPVADPDEVARDLVVLYEGVFGLLVVGLDPDPVGRARRLAAGLLDRAVRDDG